MLQQRFPIIEHQDSGIAVFSDSNNTNLVATTPAASVVADGVAALASSSSSPVTTLSPSSSSSSSSTSPLNFGVVEFAIASVDSNARTEGASKCVSNCDVFASLECNDEDYVNEFSFNVFDGSNATIQLVSAILSQQYALLKSHLQSPLPPSRLLAIRSGNGFGNMIEGTISSLFIAFLSNRLVLFDGVSYIKKLFCSPLASFIVDENSVVLQKYPTTLDVLRQSQGLPLGRDKERWVWCDNVSAVVNEHNTIVEFGSTNWHVPLLFANPNLKNLFVEQFPIHTTPFPAHVLIRKFFPPRPFLIKAAKAAAEKYDLGSKICVHVRVHPQNRNPAPSASALLNCVNVALQAKQIDSETENNKNNSESNFLSKFSGFAVFGLDNPAYEGVRSGLNVLSQKLFHSPVLESPFKNAVENNQATSSLENALTDLLFLGHCGEIVASPWSSYMYLIQAMFKRHVWQVNGNMRGFEYNSCYNTLQLGTLEPCYMDHDNGNSTPFSKVQCPNPSAAPPKHLFRGQC